MKKIITNMITIINNIRTIIEELNINKIDHITYKNMIIYTDMMEYIQNSNHIVIYVNRQLDVSELNEKSMDQINKICPKKMLKYLHTDIQKIKNDRLDKIYEIKSIYNTFATKIQKLKKLDSSNSIKKLNIKIDSKTLLNIDLINISFEIHKSSHILIKIEKDTNLNNVSYEQITNIHKQVMNMSDLLFTII